MKIVEGAKVFLLIYHDGEDGDIRVCDAYASYEKALERARNCNLSILGGSCFTEEGDFNDDEYDPCEYNYYDVTTYDIKI